MRADPRAMIHRNLLQFRGARYLWWAVALVLLSTSLYLSQVGKPAGGDTWQGYVLGSLGALLIVWLALLGIRKRRYASTLGTVHGWASAHVYLGSALLVVATLHCAVQFGFNVHTLAYVLMCLVIVSGVFGVYTYLAHPRAIAENRAGGARSVLFSELFDLDRQARALAEQTDSSVALAVSSSIERTAIGGRASVQLLGIDRSWFMRTIQSRATLVPNPDQRGVIDFVAERLPRADKKAEVTALQELVIVLCRRQAVLRRIRRDVRLHAALKAWLYVHVPLSIALLGALLVHIVVTFIYW
jgi:hypothetical protein